MNFNKTKFVLKPLLMRSLMIFFCIIVLFIISFFLFRNVVLHKVIEARISYFDKKYPAKIIIKDYKFKGITGIEFNDIYIIPENKDTLFISKSAFIQLKILPLLIGKLKLNDLEISGTKVNLVKIKSVDNFSFLLSKKPKDKNIKKNYASNLDVLSDAIFGKIPRKLLLNDFSLNIIFDSCKTFFSIPFFKMSNNNFKTIIHVKENKIEQDWVSDGSLNINKRTIDFRIYSEQGKITIPVVKNKYGLLLSFDTLKAGLLKNYYSNDNYYLSGYSSIDKALVNHKRISSKDVNVNNAAFDFDIIIGKNDVELDSSSTLAFNGFELNPYFYYKKVEKAKQFTFKLRNEFLAQKLFSSLPTGLFTNFEGIQTTGSIKLFIDFFIDSTQPDSLKFNASLAGHDFNVIKYGVTDFAMINRPFNYTVYEDGKPANTIIVGPDNPEFTPLDDVSKYLKEAILISENGGYYMSSGFDIASLRLAIIENLKQKRFVRGGSTIEMQLVKNLFLNKNKNIARKFEELLIVWLMQTNNLCDKDRMYEVYLNIVEWAPGIYGIHEASEYYFKKLPSKLTLAESLFLASILPKPKWFKYSFDKKGSLIPEYNQMFFNGIASVLLQKEIIETADTVDLLSKVRLKGESVRYMAKDTANYNFDLLMKDE